MAERGCGGDAAEEGCVERDDGGVVVAVGVGFYR
jgi:hypothetical protein